MSSSLFKFRLGVKAKDIITGYKGVVGGRTEYLTGCKQYGLIKEGLTKDGKTPDWEWFDESRLEVVKADPVKVNEKSDPGGPAPSAPQC